MYVLPPGSRSAGYLGASRHRRCRWTSPHWGSGVGKSPSARPHHCLNGVPWTRPSPAIRIACGPAAQREQSAQRHQSWQSMTAVKSPQPSSPQQIPVTSVCHNWFDAVMSNGVSCALGCRFFLALRNPKALSGRTVFFRFNAWPNPRARAVLPQYQATELRNDSTRFALSTSRSSAPRECSFTPWVRPAAPARAPLRRLLALVAARLLGRASRPWTACRHVPNTIAPQWSPRYGPQFRTR